MSCARLNLSHGTSKTNARILRKYAEAQRLRPHKNCAFMLEIRGREIRTSATVDPQGINLKSNASVYLDCSKPLEKSDAKTLHCNYKELPRLVKPNDLLYLDDGKIILLVSECEMEGIKCEVKGGGILTGNRSIKLPSGRHEHLPVLTLEDQEELIKFPK